ncbi:MAG: hypothetical protein SOT60_02145 [Bilifractor sp.]|nr:hypothetical protein [Bilifractor sp.]
MTGSNEGGEICGVFSSFRRGMLSGKIGENRIFRAQYICQEPGVEFKQDNGGAFQGNYGAGLIRFYI